MDEKEFNGAKNRNPQKAHLGVLHNVHTEFQIPGLIWKGIVQGTKSKNEKKRSTNHSFEAVRR